MSKYTNRYIPTIYNEILSNANSVGINFISLDYYGAIKFRNNQWEFYIGEDRIATIDSDGITADSSLPDQDGNSGKFLTTDGSIASWGTVPSDLPTQSGHSGHYLTTNGTTASWVAISIPTVPTIKSGYESLTIGNTDITFVGDQFDDTDYSLTWNAIDSSGDPIIVGMTNKAVGGFTVTNSPVTGTIYYQAISYTT